MLYVMHVTCHSVFEEEWENKAEWTGKANVRNADFLAVREACKALFWPTPRSTGKAFDSSPFLAKAVFWPIPRSTDKTLHSQQRGLNYYISDTLLRGSGEEQDETVKKV